MQPIHLRAGDASHNWEGQQLKRILKDFVADETGATAIEYGLIAAGIALAIIEVIYALGTDLVGKLTALATALK